MESKVIQGKAQFFFDKKVSVHISCLNERFYNGMIVLILSDSLIIKDKVHGETPIYYSEVEGIEAERRRE